MTATQQYLDTRDRIAAEMKTLTMLLDAHSRMLTDEEKQITQRIGDLLYVHRHIVELNQLLADHIAEEMAIDPGRQG